MISDLYAFAGMILPIVRLFPASTPSCLINHANLLCAQEALQKNYDLPRL